MKAIGSLCAFTHLITRFIPLVRDADAWRKLYGEELEYPSGTLKTYCSRGWCRLELLAALAPKQFHNSTWRQGSINLRFRSGAARARAPDDRAERDAVAAAGSTTIRRIPARAPCCAPSTS